MRLVASRWAKQRAPALGAPGYGGTGTQLQQDLQQAATDYRYLQEEGYSLDEASELIRDEQSTGDAGNGLGHGILDALGTIPVAGEVADGINAAWYLAEGDYTNAAISGGAMIPIVGSAAPAIKAARYADEAAGAVKVDGDAVVRHYTTTEAAKAITKTGAIRRSSDGKVYLTPDEYTNGVTAQARLALTRTPDGYFEVPMCRVKCPSGPSTVPANNGQPGGGLEITTQQPVDATGLRFLQFE